MHNALMLLSLMLEKPSYFFFIPSKEILALKIGILKIKPKSYLYYIKNIFCRHSLPHSLSCFSIEVYKLFLLNLKKKKTNSPNTHMSSDTGCLPATAKRIRDKMNV